MDVDDGIPSGLDALTAGAPDAPEWGDIERRGAVRRRRRTAIVAATCVLALFVAIAAIARVGDDDTTIVAGPTGDTIPCGAWVAVRTLFDSSANSQTGANQAVVTAEQAAFLVKSSDVPDRVARALGGNPADLASHVVAKPNSELGTIEITAWADTADEAQALAYAFGNALVASVTDIQQREIDRQRGVLTDAIAQLQLELTGITGNDRAAVAQRDRLSSEIADKEVTLQQLDQRAAQGSNIYSLGNRGEPFRVTPDQWDALYATTTTDPARPMTLPSREPGQRPAFEADCAAAAETDAAGSGTEPSKTGGTAPLVEFATSAPCGSWMATTLLYGATTTRDRSDPAAVVPLIDMAAVATAALSGEVVGEAASRLGMEADDLRNHFAAHEAGVVQGQVVQGQVVQAVGISAWADSADDASARRDAVVSALREALGAEVGLIISTGVPVEADC